MVDCTAGHIRGMKILCMENWKAHVGFTQNTCVFMKHDVFLDNKGTEELDTSGFSLWEICLLLQFWSFHGIFWQWKPALKSESQFPHMKNAFKCPFLHATLTFTRRSCTPMLRQDNRSFLWCEMHRPNTPEAPCKQAVSFCKHQRPRSA